MRIVPAPEPNHAIRAVIDEAIRGELRSRTLAGQPAHFIRTDLTDYGQGQR